MSRRSKSSPDPAEDLIVKFIILILALPFVGIYLMCRQEPDKKILGGVLLAVGIVIWIAMSA